MTAKPALTKSSFTKPANTKSALVASLSLYVLALSLTPATVGAAPLPAYTEERMAVVHQGVRMPAILTRPVDGEPQSAILLVPGSLALDVDGNLPQWNIHPHVYADFAHHLAARGHVVLRYAKIGPGSGSEIFDEKVAKVAHRRFRTRVDTARVALELLVRHAGPLPLFVAGHSEGAVVTSLLAAEVPSIRGVVSLSGPATGLFDIMREQVPPGTPPEAFEAFDRVVAELRAGRPLPEGIGDDPATVMFTRIDATGVSYLVEVDAVDPCQALAAVEAPVLIVQGGRDGSVREHHAEQLLAARGDRATETAFFPELQHFYKVVGEDVDPMAAFSIDTENDPAVSDAIDLWLRRILSSEH